MTHVHVIDRNFVGGLGFDLLKDYPKERYEIRNFIDTIVKKYLIGDVVRGDTLVFEKLGYRGSNVYFWDGRKVISAGTNYADTGNVPEEFLVQNGDFSPDYWSELIEKSKEDLDYQYFTELTLGPNLQAQLREGAAKTPGIVKATINGKEFSFFIQKNGSREDIENSWLYYVGNNTVVQADVDQDWHPEAENFKGILGRMKAVQNGGKRRSRSRKNRKATRRSRK